MHKSVQFPLKEIQVLPNLDKVCTVAQPNKKKKNRIFFVPPHVHDDRCPDQRVKRLAAWWPAHQLQASTL